MRCWTWIVLYLVCGLVACGGGGGGSTASQSSVNPIATNGVDSIPISIAQFSGWPSVTANMPYVTVTVCDSTNTCASIDNVLLDTGSTGLRLKASAVTSSGLSLSAITTSGSNILAECAYFASGYLWGALRQATVRLGQSGTTATIPIQIIGDGSVPANGASQNCTRSGFSNLSNNLPAKGILGVGNAIDDTASGTFYSCGSSSCSSVTTASVSSLNHAPRNPVANFPSGYNNGLIIQMPSVASAGAASASGALVLGVNTTGNNQMPGSAQYYALDASGYLAMSVTFNGVTTARSGFLDTGSNGYFLALSGMPQCSAGYSGFYCPTSATSLTLTISSGSASSGSINASIDNARNLLLTGNTAQPQLGGPSNGPVVDLGLPFFYGRSIAIGLENSTRNGTPYPYGFVAF